MRQISDLSSIPESGNASTCGFFERKGRCGRGFRNLPHTSALGFRKCGEKPKSADQTPVLRFRDLRFCCHNLGCARRVPIFPRTSGNQVLQSRYLGSRCALSSGENLRSPHLRRFCRCRFKLETPSSKAVEGVFSVGFLLIPLVAPYDQNLRQAYK